MNVEDHFSNGYAYEPHTGIPRPSCCGSCAFRGDDASVRPAGVTIAKVERVSAGFDDFVCHTPNADGSYPSCAGWWARFKESNNAKYSRPPDHQ